MAREETPVPLSSLTDGGKSVAREEPIIVNAPQPPMEADIVEPTISETVDDEADSYSTNSTTSTAASDDGDDGDDDESWCDTLRSSWRQHCAAVAVAVAATALAFYHQHWQLARARAVSVREAPGRRARTMMAAPTPFPGGTTADAGWAGDDQQQQQYQAHPHLRNYQRTSNISFCGGQWTEENQKKNNNERVEGGLEGGLELMDFHVPKDLVDVMAAHFLADLYQDDNYEIIISSDNLKKNEQQQHPEIACMNELLQQTGSNNGGGGGGGRPSSFIKGVTYFYRAPSIESMYRSHIEKHQQVASVKKRAQHQAVELSFPGFAAKFVNLTPQPVLLHWDGRPGLAPRRLVGELAPFEALTTATRPGEAFSVSPVYDPSDALDRWTVTPEDSVVYYEGLRHGNQQQQQQSRTAEQELQYQMQKLNQEFAMHYLIHSGRNWLSHFPRRFPVHPMWSADHFGQTHTVRTFRVDEHDRERPTTLTLEVASVTPRVFLIRNFLSPLECETLQQMALHQGLKGSTLYAGSLARQQRDLSTRSSSNAWLARRAANVTDRLYRRAAHALELDERLLQAEFVDDNWDARRHSVAESLQVVRYRRGEEYAPHHDWVPSDQRNRHQPTRFATLLAYLNDDFAGGRTVFPRAANAQNPDGVAVAPQRGTAVLFYNLLPDGNVDDLSQHGSEPVTEGEKFAANLWVWDPVIN